VDQKLCFSKNNFINNTLKGDNTLFTKHDAFARNLLGDPGKAKLLLACVALEALDNEFHTSKSQEKFIFRFVIFFMKT
jgi:hypothetical protein